MPESLPDDVLLAKAEIISRCLARVREEYEGREEALARDFTRQDAIVLNLQRACQAAIDGAMHVVRVWGLGLPGQSRDAFVMMRDAGLLAPDLCESMMAMVGFRNVIVHNYREMSLEILRAVLDHHLDDFRAFERTLVGLAMPEGD